MDTGLVDSLAANIASKFVGPVSIVIYYSVVYQVLLRKKIAYLCFSSIIAVKQNRPN